MKTDYSGFFEQSRLKKQTFKQLSLLFTLLCFAFVGYAQCPTGETEINITTTGGSFTSEKWVNITTGINGTGTQVWGQGNGTYGNGQGLINQDICLAPGTYYVNCYDRYSDGWDGTQISVTSFGNLLNNNGGVSPNNFSNDDSTSGWETPEDELEASLEIVVLPPPSCLLPSNLTASNLDTTSVDLSWDEEPTATLGYQWVVMASGDAPVVDGSEVATGNTASDTFMHSVSGLSSGTPYDAYVRSICDGGEFSDWSSVSSFTTQSDFCAGDNFVDSGGVGGSYSNNENITTTISPDNSGDVVTVTFLSFDH